MGKTEKEIDFIKLTPEGSKKYYDLIRLRNFEISS